MNLICKLWRHVRNLPCLVWKHDDPLRDLYASAFSEIDYYEMGFKLSKLDSTPRKCLRCGEELGR